MNVLARLALFICVSTAVLNAVDAQLNNAWVTFTPGTNRIRNPDGSTATQVTTDTDEKDYAWGDVNNDGWIDLVVVRKQGWTNLGKRVNQLLMNEGGILVDRTSQYAVDSDVPGDFGFMTPTNDRDVQVADLNGDGWPEIVTAVTQSDGDPKHLSHPRVYRNKGAVGGVWQGFRYEDARIPQLITIPGGLAVAPNFMSVSVGDVTGDGFPDLYFTDHDSTSGSTEQPANDLNDRLLINDGFGNFSDSLATRMTSAMLQSEFATASNILDINGDGARDVFKLSSGSPFPPQMTVAYNTAASVGTFTQSSGNIFAIPSTAYHVDAGDLNRDGRPDLVISEDGVDNVRFNLGNDVTGKAIFGPVRTYNFLSGVDDGFAGNIRIADLDADGWPETIHADVDNEIAGCTRYCHIYHNRAGAIGSEIILRQEAQMSGAGGWKGAVGLLVSDLSGTFDVAVFDIDNDGDLDLVFGRCTGTFVWINQLPPIVSLVCSGDGSATACPCGNASPVGSGAGCLNSNTTAGTLRASGGARVGADTFTLLATGVPDGPGLFVQSTAVLNGGAGIAFGDGLLCVSGTSVRLGVHFASGNASQYPTVGFDPAISVQGLVAPTDTRHYQLWYRDNVPTFCTSATFNQTNALSVTWQN